MPEGQHLKTWSLWERNPRLILGDVSWSTCLSPQWQFSPPTPPGWKPPLAHPLLLWRLTRKPLNRLLYSRLSRLSRSYTLERKKEKVGMQSTTGLPTRNKNHPAGTRRPTLNHKHMIHFSQLVCLLNKSFLYNLKSTPLLCCSFQSSACKLQASVLLEEKGWGMLEEGWRSSNNGKKLRRDPKASGLYQVNVQINF